MRTMSWIRRGIPALLVGMLGCGAAASPDASEGAADALRGRELPEPLARPDFVFTDTDGQPYDFRARTDGKLALLFFGFTHCPDVCPVHLANLAAVLRDMPSAARRRIDVVFVSADPDRDTPERLREWLDAFDHDFVGLRAPLEQVNAVLEALGTVPAQHGEPDASGDYGVGHPAQIFAFGPAGPARVVYPFGTRQVDWAHDLPRLLADTAGAPASTARLPAGGAPMSAGVATRAGSAPSIGGASSSGAVPPGVSELAWVPLPPADGPAALYLTLRNPGSRPDALVGAATRAAGRVEMHRQEHGAGGSTMMHAVTQIPVPARDSTRLAPGGYHLMLRDLARTLVVGDTLTVALTFRSGATARTRAVVLPYSSLPAVAAPAGPR